MFKPAQGDIAKPKRGLLAQGAGRHHHYHTWKAMQMGAAGISDPSTRKAEVHGSKEHCEGTHQVNYSHGLEDKDANTMTAAAIRHQGWEVLA